jgi:hypothetical protein
MNGSSDSPLFLMFPIAVIMFVDEEFLSLKRIELHQPELAIKLFVQHVGRFLVGGCQTAFHLRRETTRA